MKKLLIALGLLGIITVIALFTGCDCTNSNINPDDYGKYTDYTQTTGSTAVGTQVR